MLPKSSNVSNVGKLMFLLQLKSLERMTYLNGFGDDFGHKVHDLYKEFAEWHVAQSTEEDANEATCIYYTCGARVVTMLEKGRVGECWRKLLRVCMYRVWKVNILPPHSKEWANEVVLHLEVCPDLTSLNLQEMECLQHLAVFYCESLEKLEVSVEEERMPRLQYLAVVGNYVLNSMPGVWRCVELVHVEIIECPKLLLQSMDVKACPKLQHLSIMWSCEMGLPKVELTQNLQLLRFSESH